MFNSLFGHYLTTFEEEDMTFQGRLRKLNVHTDKKQK